MCVCGGGVDRGADVCPLLHCRPPPAATAGTTPTFITAEKPTRCTPSSAGTPPLVALSKRSESVGKYICLASGSSGGSIHGDWSLFLPRVPAIEDAEPLQTSQLAGFSFFACGMSLCLKRPFCVVLLQKGKE